MKETWDVCFHLFSCLSDSVRAAPALFPAIVSENGKKRSFKNVLHR